METINLNPHRKKVKRACLMWLRQNSISESACGYYDLSIGELMEYWKERKLHLKILPSLQIEFY